MNIMTTIVIMRIRGQSGRMFAQSGFSWERNAPLAKLAADDHHDDHRHHAHPRPIRAHFWLKVVPS